MKKQQDEYSDDAAASDDTSNFLISDEEDAKSYDIGGYHPVCKGEVYNHKYKIVGKLGWGHFSTVWLATDLTSAEYVAIKFQKSLEHYTEAALDEIELLISANHLGQDESWLADLKSYHNTLGSRCPTSSGVVMYLDYFEHQGPNGLHVCMVFEVMGPNLLALIKKYNFDGVPLNLVRKIACHVLVALDFLHRVCGIMHTDIKPENILVSSAYIPPPKEVEVETKVEKNDEYMFDDIIFEKFRLKPSRSDPSLSSMANSYLSYEQQLLNMNPPYHHLKYKLQNGDQNDLVTKGICLHMTSEPLITNSNVYLVETVEGVIDLKSFTNMFEYFDSEYYIADLGNGCRLDKDLNGDIQTRQYRSPEVLLGANYDATADMWSFACMIFELVTSDFLFDSHASSKHVYTRDEDHLALIIELVGPIPPHLIDAGTKKDLYFDSKYQLKNIHDFKSWPLHEVMIQKYDIPQSEAIELASFLLPMLTVDPSQRASAAEMLNHPWLLAYTEEPHVDIENKGNKLGK